MQLITKEIAQRFQEIGEQIYANDPIIVCKFFTPRSNWTRYVSEWYPDSQVCYGYTVGSESERGYFALPELEAIVSPYGLKIERDIYFGECLFSNLK